MKVDLSNCSRVIISVRMLIKYGDRTQPCRTPLYLSRNDFDSVPASLTLASCFLYSLTSKSIKCRGYPTSIIDRVKRLPLVYKAHIKWLLMLACLVYQYSEIRVSRPPPSLSESRLFICYFRFVFTRILSSIIRSEQ